MEDSKRNKAMYIQIADDIRRKILNKLINEDEKLPSEAELADQYNVSRITSQKALNVLANEGLIYRVKGSGSFVAKQNQVNSKKALDMIAIILPFDHVHGGGMDILRGAETVASENGYYVSLHNSQRSPTTEREIILQLLKDGVSGIIYYPMHTSENFDLLYMLTADKYPIVMIDKYAQDIPIDSVVSDNISGGYMMTEYLIKSGHKNIAFVSGEPMDQLSSEKERFLGYFKALRDNDVPINIDNVIYNFSDLAGKWHLDRIDNEKFFCILLDYILNLKERITCIQAVSDSVAIDILKAAQLMKLCIPQELSIVGFDNLDMTTLVTPSLTTVKQDFCEIGARGAELAIGRIKNPNKDIEHIRIDVELIIRESVLDKTIL
jgi:GntR family transcriptional regulator of arabinose operon